MNIKRLLPFTVIAIFVLLTSCSITNPYAGKLKGTWVALKAAPSGEMAKNFNPEEKPRPPKSLSDTSKAAREAKVGKDGKTERSPEEIEYQKQLMFHQLVRAESTSKLIVLDSKKAQKVYQSKTVNLRYKIKKKGKQLVVKDKEHGKMTGDVELLNDSLFTVIEHFPVGDIIVVYKKK